MSLNLGTTQKGVCYNLVYKVINEAFRGQDTCLRFLPSRWWSQDLTPACLSPHSQASLQAWPRVISVHWKWLLYLWKYSPTSNTTPPHYPQPGSNRKQCEVIIAYPPQPPALGFYGWAAKSLLANSAGNVQTLSRIPAKTSTVWPWGGESSQGGNGIYNLQTRGQWPKLSGVKQQRSVGD